MSTGQIAGFAVTGGGLAHAVAAFAFLVLVILLLTGWRRGVLGAYVIVASLVTMLWAGLAAYDREAQAGLERAVAVMEVLRAAAWIAFLLKYLFVNWPTSWTVSVRYSAAGLFGAVVIANIGLTVFDTVDGGPLASLTGVVPRVAGNLVLSVIGLLLAENMYRNSTAEQRWRIKFLCFGLAGMFAFDFFIYSEAMLFSRADPTLLDARGLADALIVPLIAVSTVRNPDWTLNISVSRDAVFHTTALVGSGIYLLGMAAVGFYIRRFGGEWGPVLQGGFLFAAIILLVLIISSGGYRARVKVFISKHFFSYKYDYRSEWLRVIATMSSLEANGGLPARVVEAVAEIVESPEGALWLRQDENRFAMICAMNCTVPEETQTLAPRLGEFFETRQWVIELDDAQRFPAEYSDVALPEWLDSGDRAWLVVPMLHHDRLTALLMLGRPRAPRRLNWEDYDLLRTVGRQAASYLAEQVAARTVAESRQFDEFNRRFAFVVHDIKNLVSQLSLMLSNAGRFKEIPEFQDDMLETVRGSVTKMNGMLVRLSEGAKDAAAAGRIDLTDFLRGAVADNNRSGGGKLTFTSASGSISVVADKQKLAAVLAHLIGNALDAAGAQGTVEVRLSVESGDAVIDIVDDGPGMAPEFVRDELFRPFRSTKDSGYGIGAFESRELVRQLGGQLDVHSRVGDGTTFRIRFPAHGPAVAPEPLGSQGA